MKDRFRLTNKGSSYLEYLNSKSLGELTKEQQGTWDFLEAVDNPKGESMEHYGREIPKALRQEWIERELGPEEIIYNISLRDPQLASCLETYLKVATKKPVREEDLDRAIALVKDKITKLEISGAIGNKLLQEDFQEYSRNAAGNKKLELDFLMCGWHERIESTEDKETQEVLSFLGYLRE